MSFDFRADQVRTGRIISSGSSPLLIYPSSSASDLQGGLASFSTASIGSDVFLFISGSSSERSLFGGDVRVSGSLTASIRTVDGTNNLIVGSGITANFNSTGQWELTGSSITVGGSDASVQFNQNGSLSGTSSFTYFSGSLGVQTISGANPDVAAFGALGVTPGLYVSSNLAFSNSVLILSGQDELAEIGGVVMSDRTSINFFSASIGENPEFSLEAAETPNWANMSLRGELNVVSGSVKLSSPDVAALQIYSGSAIGQGSLAVYPGTTADELNIVLTGSMTASRLSVPEITGSIRYSQTASNFIVGRNVNVSYNVNGQWELTGALQRVNVANYSRSNLTAASVIGYAYFNPSDYPAATTLTFEAVGMNMGGVSGGLSLYNQTDAAVEATLSWSGASTLTTGSYQSTTLAIPPSSKNYEIHLSQSGGTDGGASYTSVGFVNFTIS